MKEVTNFPVCEETVTKKFIWNDEDSQNGVDVPVWIQHSYDIDCADELDCEENCKYYYNALYVEGKRGKKCYAYEANS